MGGATEEHGPAYVDPGALIRFIDVLRRAGADLVLHGYNHQTQIETVPGPNHPIPVIGVRSASDVGERPGRRAQYHLYDIEPGRDGAPPRIGVRTRGYDESTGTFRSEESPSVDISSPR